MKLKMDKNKSAYKLKGIPKIYWLNLDGDIDRFNYMKSGWGWDSRSQGRDRGVLQGYRLVDDGNR